jgi:hypothetical protein
MLDALELRHHLIDISERALGDPAGLLPLDSSRLELADSLLQIEGDFVPEVIGPHPVRVIERAPQAHPEPVPRTV